MRATGSSIELPKSRRVWRLFDESRSSAPPSPSSSDFSTGTRRASNRIRLTRQTHHLTNPHTNPQTNPQTNHRQNVYRSDVSGAAFARSDFPQLVAHPANATPRRVPLLQNFPQFGKPASEPRNQYRLYSATTAPTIRFGTVNHGA